MKPPSNLNQQHTRARFYGLRSSVSLAVALAMLVSSGQALADDSGSWQWRATIYAWLPTFDASP